MQNIGIVYGGSASRLLKYRTKSPVAVNGDDKAICFKFDIPSSYDTWGRMIEFDVQIKDDDGELLYPAYPLLSDDSFLIPYDVAKYGNGQTATFHLILSDTSDPDNPVVEVSLGLSFDINYAQDAIESATSHISPIILYRAFGAVEYIPSIEVGAQYESPQLLFTSLNGARVFVSLDEFGTVDSRINNEIQRATDAETILSGRIDQTNMNLSFETLSRQDADTALQNSIDNLQDSINAEETRATGAENALSTRITNETSARQSADTTLQSNIDAEVSRATGVENGLSGQISDLSTALSNETSARQSADSTLDGRITDIVNGSTPVAKAGTLVDGNGPISEGTDTKPVKFVDGVPVAITNDLVDVANAQTIGGVKTFSDGIVSDVAGNLTGDVNLSNKSATSVLSTDVNKNVITTPLGTETQVLTVGANNSLGWQSPAGPVNGGTGIASTGALYAEQQARINTDATKIDTAGTGLSKSGTTLNHSNSVVAGQVGTASKTPTIVFDSEGHITSDTTDQNIQITESQVTDLVSDLASKLNKDFDDAVHYGNVSTTPSTNGVSLSITRKSTSSGLGDTQTLSLPVATNASAGVATASQIQQIEQNTADIASLQGKSTRYAISVDVSNLSGSALQSALTSAWESASGLSGTPDDYTTLVNLYSPSEPNNHEYTWMEFNGVTAWVDRGASTVAIATNTSLGIVMGTEPDNVQYSTDGSIYVESDGTMDVLGWDRLTGRVDGIESALPNKLDKIANTSGVHAYTHDGSTQGEIPVKTDATASSIAQRDNQGDLTAGTFHGDLNGNADSATVAGAFSSAKTVELTGDVTGTDSSTGGWTIATSLKNSGVTADDYGPGTNQSPALGGTFTVPSYTVNAKGIITSSIDRTVTLPTVSWADVGSKPIVTSWSNPTSDTNIPSEKLVKSALDNKIGSVNQTGSGYVSGIAVDSTNKSQLNVTRTAIPDVAVSGGSVESGKYVSSIASNGHGISVGKESLPTLSKGTDSGDGNVVTDVSVSGHTITLTKGITALTSHQSIKTINGTSMVGTGDISLQVPLVGSGTGQNIKTVGGTNILGTGDIPFPDTSSFVEGPSSSTDSSVALFDGTTGKIIKDSEKTLGASIPSITPNQDEGKALVVNNSGTAFVFGEAGKVDDVWVNGSSVVGNDKIARVGAVTSVATGVGLAGGPITSSGTIKASLKSETASSLASASMGSTAGRQYAVGVDKDGYLSVNVPWQDNYVGQYQVSNDVNRPLALVNSTVESPVNFVSSVNFSTNAYLNPSKGEITANRFTGLHSGKKTALTSYTDSTVCTLFTIAQADYQANGYNAYIKFRFKSGTSATNQESGECYVVFAKNSATIRYWTGESSATSLPISGLYAYYPNSTSLATKNCYIAMNSSAYSIPFEIEVLEADIDYTLATTLAPFTDTTDMTFQYVSIGLGTEYSGGWTGLMQGNISGQSGMANYSYYSLGLQENYALSGESLSITSLCALSSDGKSYKVNNGTSKFTLPIDMFIPYIDHNANQTVEKFKYRGQISYSISYLTNASYQGRAFTIPTLTSADYNKTLYIRGSIDSDGLFVPDGNITVTMSAGYTFIPFGRVIATSNGDAPTYFALDCLNSDAYTLDSGGKLTHINGKQIDGAVQLTDVSANFVLQSTPDYAEFPYRATINRAGVTSSTYVQVTFSNSQAESMIYSPVAVSGTDVIYLYARQNVGTQVIPTISIGMDTSDMTVDNVPTSGSTNPVSSGGVYDALPHGNIGSDTKPVKIVNGQAVAVANDLLDGWKTYNPSSWSDWSTFLANHNMTITRIQQVNWPSVTYCNITVTFNPGWGSANPSGVYRYEGGSSPILIPIYLAGTDLHLVDSGHNEITYSLSSTVDIQYVSVYYLE